MLKVYLAGAVRGPKSDWRDRIAAIPSVCFMHPGAAIADREAERRTERYGPADRIAVRHCDILLANCDRPEGGLGTAVEIGMALALGKEVFLVCPDEKSRYVWRFAVGSTPTVYASVDEAVDVIRYVAAQLSGAARCAAS